jgi:hypothetical protein
MLVVVFLSVFQCPHRLAALLLTGTRYMVETGTDDFWGNNPRTPQRGQNVLGRIYMKIRQWLHSTIPDITSFRGSTIGILHEPSTITTHDKGSSAAALPASPAPSFDFGCETDDEDIDGFLSLAMGVSKDTENGPESLPHDNGNSATTSPASPVQSVELTRHKEIPLHSQLGIGEARAWVQCLKHLCVLAQVRQMKNITAALLGHVDESNYRQRTDHPAYHVLFSCHAIPKFTLNYEAWTGLLGSKQAHRSSMRPSRWSTPPTTNCLKSCVVWTTTMPYLLLQASWCSDTSSYFGPTQGTPRRGCAFVDDLASPDLSPLACGGGAAPPPLPQANHWARTDNFNLPSHGNTLGRLISASLTRGRPKSGAGGSARFFGSP